MDVPFRILSVTTRLLVLSIGSAQLLAAGQGFCKRYAQDAINTFQAAQEERCENLNYPVWSMDFNHHYNWCMSGENLKYAKAEQKKRQDRLAQCHAKKALPELQGDSSILDRTRRVQLDKVFVQAVDLNATELEKKIRAIQEQSWNKLRNMVLGRFRGEVKAATYSQKKTLSRLPGRAGNIGQTPTIIGEIDRQTGEVGRGGGRPAPSECEGVRYYGKPRIPHILSSTKADDYFFRKKALPPLFSIKKAYLIPKMLSKDWAGLVSRITRDAIDTVSSIASGDILGAAMSLGGLGVESMIKWLDPSVGKYGVWVTEFPPSWPHYRSHWNNTCYTKSPRFGQVIEYVGSFLVMGPDGADLAPGWKNRYGVDAVSLAP